MDPQLLAIYNALVIGTYWEEVERARTEPLLGPTLFPPMKKVGLDLAWLKGMHEIPVVLQPSAFDTKASLRDRIGVTELQESMPFFREAMRIGEKDRQDLMNYLNQGPAYAKTMLRKLYDDNGKLLDGAVAQCERMRMSLITTGKIYIQSTGETGGLVKKEIVYDPTGKWYDEHVTQLTGNSTWSVENKATSDPIQDLLDIIEKMKEEGKMPGKIIMNTTTLNGALASDSIIKAMNPVGAENAKVTNRVKRDYVESMIEVPIVVYDKVYKDENKITKKYIPDWYVSIVPAGTLGNTWFGTTPEEFDLMNAKEEVVTGKDAPNGGAISYVTAQGPCISSIKEPHPVNISTIVSMITLPSFERMDDVYVLRVQVI